MKTIKLNEKLQLNKEVVSNLNQVEMINVVGGRIKEQPTGPGCTEDETITYHWNCQDLSGNINC